jgi:hypothetical protein
MIPDGTLWFLTASCGIESGVIPRRLNPAYRSTGCSRRSDELGRAAWKWRAEPDLRTART